jgi:hypothetical protein
MSFNSIIGINFVFRGPANNFADVKDNSKQNFERKMPCLFVSGLVPTHCGQHHRLWHGRRGGERRQDEHPPPLFARPNSGGLFFVPQKNSEFGW